MKIVLSQGVLVNENSKKFGEFCNITKSIESNAIPHKGDYIADSLYKDPYEYEVTNVTLNYQENYCYVTISPMIVGSKDSVKKIKEEIAPLHGWK